MAACLLVIVGTALTAAASGLSMTLGAFVAGLLLAETEYRRAIEATIDPFKGLLLGVFFVSVGMNLDPAQLMAAPGAILGLALALIADQGRRGRDGGARSSSSRGRWRSRRRCCSGPGGEFAFVLIGGAMAAGLVPEEVGAGRPDRHHGDDDRDPGPGRARAAARQRASAGAQLGRARAEPVPEPAAEPGHHRGLRPRRAAGRRDAGAAQDPLSRPRRRRGPGRRAAPRSGSRSISAIPANPELLRRCDIATARALVVTLDNPRAVEAVVEAARAERRGHHHRGPGPRRPPCHRALRTRRRRRGAGDDRGLAAALGGRAGRCRRADGPRHRLDPRAAGRVPRLLKKRENEAQAGLPGPPHRRQGASDKPDRPSRGGADRVSEAEPARRPEPASPFGVEPPAQIGGTPRRQLGLGFARRGCAGPARTRRRSCSGRRSRPAARGR